jgi:hypothetical protein
MGEQITVNAVGSDRYRKLSELVRNTHKEKPKQEDLAALRRFFDEDPELWQATGKMANGRWNTSAALTIKCQPMCRSVFYVELSKCAKI